MVAARGSWEFFKAVLKKPKQPLKEFLARMPLSDADIDSSTQPKWMKPHLKRWRVENYPTPEEKSARQEWLDQTWYQPAQGKTKDEAYPTYIYEGSKQWVGPARGSQVEAGVGDIFQVIQGNLRWETMFISVDKNSLDAIINTSKYLGDYNPREYAVVRQEQIKKRNGIEDYISTPGKVTSGEFTHLLDKSSGTILET